MSGKIRRIRQRIKDCPTCPHVPNLEPSLEGCLEGLPSVPGGLPGLPGGCLACLGFAWLAWGFACVKVTQPLFSTLWGEGLKHKEQEGFYVSSHWLGNPGD